MPVHQLGKLTYYKEFTDWLNNTYADGETPQKGVSSYTTTEFTADPLTHYAW